MLSAADPFRGQDDWILCGAFHLSIVGDGFVFLAPFRSVPVRGKICLPGSDLFLTEQGPIHGWNDSIVSGPVRRLCYQSFPHGSRVFVSGHHRRRDSWNVGWHRIVVAMVRSTGFHIFDSSGLFLYLPDFV